MTVGNLSQRERLSTELKTLRREARITQQGLCDASGVGTTTIKDIEKAAIIPKPDTLRLLANGLATDGAGQRCESKAERYYNRLMFSAGHISALLPESPATTVVTPSPEAVLADITRDAAFADLLARTAHEYAGRTPDQQRFARELLQMLHNR